MSKALDELMEANASYTATDTGLDPRKRQQRIDALAGEEQMTDGEIILKRLFHSPLGRQSLDHLLSCWRPGKGRGWTDARVLKTLNKLVAAGLVEEAQIGLPPLDARGYEVTELAKRHYNENGRKAA